MTLLSIAQDILGETKSTQIPDSIINNNNDAAKQVLKALKKAIISVSRAMEWQELQKEYSFNSVASTEAYSLPSDFSSIISNTFWNVTNNRIVLGKESPADWRFLKNSTVSSSSINDYYRIRGKEVLIFPTPTTAESYIFEYVSNNIVEDSGGNGQSEWEADTDVPVVDEYLVKLNALWRFLKMQGKPYAEEQRDYDEALFERISKNGGNSTISPKNYILNAKVGYPDIVTP